MCSRADTPDEVRVCEAVAYRIGGATWAMVARELGFPTEQAAEDAVVAHMEQERSGR